MSWSAGAALLALYGLMPDMRDQLGPLSQGEAIGTFALLWGALTAVIAPFAQVGKAGLDRLAAWVAGKESKKQESGGRSQESGS